MQHQSFLRLAGQGRHSLLRCSLVNLFQFPQVCSVFATLPYSASHHQGAGNANIKAWKMSEVVSHENH